MISSIPKRQKQKLFSWFEKNQRDLPWRQTKDPYKIWISEVLLQQTTSKAVIPYYKKFLRKFPDISSLAKAKKPDVFSLWSGLGYYKRAENLLLSAKELSKKKSWPKSHKALLKFPGFGPYTARALSSLAFEEPVGVLDGNVIRFLSRFHALSLKSWTAKGRDQFQRLSDLWVQKQKSSVMNQALMELGSLICRGKKPLCLLCPLSRDCLAFKKRLQARLPLKRPKALTEFWHYQPEKIKKGCKLAFVKNENWPFLKGCLIFPGRAQKLKAKAPCYDFVHSIMNYQIFVTVQNPARKKSLWPAGQKIRWLSLSEIQKLNPSSLIKKVFDQA